MNFFSWWLKQSEKAAGLITINLLLICCMVGAGLNGLDWLVYSLLAITLAIDVFIYKRMSR